MKVTIGIIYIDRYDNAQTAYTNFNAFIVANFENCFPKQTVKITYKNRCEWIDQNLKNDIARRKTLFVKKQTEIPHRRKC